MRHIWRNGWLSLATIVLLSLTILTVDVLFAMQQIGATAVRAVEDKLDVSLYFSSGTPPETVAAAAAYLRGLPEVRDVSTITPEEALARFEREQADNPAVLEALAEVQENPFTDTLVVKARRAEDFPTILAAADHPQFRDAIQKRHFSNYQSIVDRIQQTVNNVQTFGAGLAALFLFISILIVFNTVRITFYLYHEEISIMRLVGATSAFIRAPFFLAALFFSACAVLLATALAWLGVSLVEPYLNTFFVDTPVHIRDQAFARAPILLIGEFVGLSFVSVVSTWGAMRRYLKI